MISHEVFWNKAKNLPTLEPNTQCPECGDHLLITDQVESVESDYFKKDNVQKCIVRCSKCKTEYLSDYDSIL